MNRPHYDHALVMRARDYAVEAHGAQLYGIRPYVFHLDATVKALMKMRADSSALAAGYLHDTLEDCNSVTMANLREDFGMDVARMVFNCTGQGTDRLSRMQDKAQKISQCSSSAQVALADRYANMNQCIEDGNQSMLARYANELPLFLPIFLGANRLMALELMALASAAQPEMAHKFSLTE